MPIIKSYGNLSPQLSHADIDHPIVEAAAMGVNPKKIYKTLDGELFLAKILRPFKGKDIFSKNLPNSDILIEEVYKQHLHDLLIETAYVECLTPLLASRLFDGIFIAPKNYFHIGSDEVLVLSNYIDSYNEFLAKKPLMHGWHPDFWQSRSVPNRDEVQLTCEEAEIVGVIFAVSTLFNNWDILNSHLQNFGCVNASAELKACIVDWGKSLHQATRGYLCDEDAFYNHFFKPNTPITYNFNYQDYDPLRHSMPFDGRVFPLSKNCFVRDLFDMSAEDDISQAMLLGFQKAIDCAKENIDGNPNLFREALFASKELLTQDSVIEFSIFESSINKAFYGFEPTTGDDSYTLPVILEERLKELSLIAHHFREGVHLTHQSELVRDQYFRSQMTPRP